jgi:transcription-repair coupling factor (superfamily II helicase)
MVTLWESLSKTLRASEPFRRLKGGARNVERLPLPAAAWVGSLLGREKKQPLLVVVPREADALAWIEASRLFTHEESSAVYFPAPSLSPFQEAETSLLVRSQEAVALDRVLRGEAGAIVCTPRALFRRLPRRQDFLSLTYTVRPDEEHPIEDLIARLHALQPNPIVVVMSNEFEYSRTLLKSGADAFVSKEDQPDWLLDTLHRYAQRIASGR